LQSTRNYNNHNKKEKRKKRKKEKKEEELTSDRKTSREHNSKDMSAYGNARLVCE